MSKKAETGAAASVTVLARNCDVDTELRAHLDEKIAHLQRLWTKPAEAQVRVSQERGRYAAEITLLAGGLVMRGEERAGNLRQAFDTAVEKLEGQLKRYKQKAQARKRRHDNRDDAAATMLKPTLAAGAAAAGAGNGATNATPVTAAAAAGETGSDDDADQLVRVKRFALKPMAPEEAALQMDLLGHSFFVFRDARNNQVSVVYRRSSGGYGLIEPVAD